MTQLLVKLVANFSTTLASRVAIAATTATLTSATDKDGNSLAAGTYGFTIDEGTASEEHITAVVSGTALSSIKTIARGTGNGTAGFAKVHRKGATIKITDFVAIKRILDVLDGTTGIDSATPLEYDAEPTWVYGQHQLVTWDKAKDYADAIAVAGAPDAGDATKGLVEIANQAEVNEGDDAGSTSAPVVLTPSKHLATWDMVVTTDYTYGATIAAGNAVYLDTADAKWKLADADSAASATGIIGIALDAGVDTDTGKRVQIAGVVTGLSGLSVGHNYLTATAGALSTTAGTNKKLVGYAINATTLVMALMQRPVDLEGVSANVTATNLNTLTAGKTSAGDALHSHINQNVALVAGENITADKPVYRHYADQKLYTSHGFKETLDTSNIGTTDYECRRANLDGTYFVEIFRSAVNSLSVRVVSSTTFDTADTEVVSTSLEDANAGIVYAGVARISNTKFIIFWANMAAAVRYRTGTFNGSSITLDTDTDYGFDADGGLAVSNALVDNKCVFTSRHSTSSRLRYLTVDTNSVTTVTESTDTITNTVTGIACCMDGTGVAYGVVVENSSQMTVTAIDTNTATANTPYTVTFVGDSSTFAANDKTPSLLGHIDRGLMAWNETVANTSGDLTYVCLFELYFSGYTFKIMQLTGTTGVSSSRSVAPCYGTMEMAYIGTGEVYRMGKVFPVSTRATISQHNRGANCAAIAMTKDKVALTSGSTSHALEDWWTPVDGIAPDAITSGNTGVMSILIAEGLSSLTANRHYYLKDTYTTAGDLDVKGGIPVGIALTTTSILMERYV